MARLVTPSYARNRRPRTPIPPTTRQKHTTDASTSTDSPRQNPPHKPNLPSLTTEVATSKAQLIQALKLVADSVAQQRQVAATAVIFHWRSWSIMTVVFVFAYLVSYKDRPDWPRVFMTCIAVLLAGLIVIRAWVGGYILEAQRVGTLKWLGDDDLSLNVTALAGRIEEGIPDRWRLHVQEGYSRGVDVVLTTTFGEKVIATVVMRVFENVEQFETRSLISDEAESEADEAGSNAGAVRMRESPAYAAFIRAWTVEQRYRGVGVGAAILKDAAMLCVEADIQPLAFSDLHANSLRILPDTFNYKMDLDCDRANGYLKRLMVESNEQLQFDAPRTSLQSLFDDQLSRRVTFNLG
jgi:hypothetical protein